MTCAGAWLRGGGLAALLVIPLAGGLLRRGERAEGALALLCTSAGLVLLDGWLRPRVRRAPRVLALVLVVYATFLSSALRAPSGGRAGAAFLGGALALAVATREGLPGWGRLGGLLAPAVLVAVEARLAPAPFFPLEALWSPRVGLLHWNPALWAGLLGLAWQAARDRGEGRRLAMSVALTLGSFVVFARPGPVADARFAPGLALAATGWAWLLQALEAAVSARPGLAVAAAGLPLVAWNLLFMQLYGTPAIPRDDTVAFPEVARGNALLLARAVGSPLAWPAAWVYAFRHSLPAEHYDALTGRVLFADGALEARLEMGAEAAPGPFLAGSWGVRRPCGGAVCRDLLGPAQVRFFLDRRESLRVALVMGGRGDVQVTLNERGLGGWRVPHDLAGVGWPVPAHGFRRGVNVLELTPSPGSVAWVARGVLERGRP
jgi:hypothetical protein